MYMCVYMCVHTHIPSGFCLVCPMYIVRSPEHARRCRLSATKERTQHNLGEPRIKADHFECSRFVYLSEWSPGKRISKVCGFYAWFKLRCILRLTCILRRRHLACKNNWLLGLGHKLLCHFRASFHMLLRRQLSVIPRNHFGRMTQVHHGLIFYSVWIVGGEIVCSHLLRAVNK